MRSLEADPISLLRLSKLLASAGPSAGLARKKKIRHFWILYLDESPLSKRHSYNNRSIFIFGLAPKTLAAGTYHQRSTSRSGEMDQERATFVGSPSSPVLANALRSQRLILT